MGQDNELMMGVPHVLVVDDEQTFQDLLKRTLSTAGYEVTTADDGEEAIELIEEQYFDLVMTDQKMPKKSGLEVLEAVREISPSTLVIIITGYASLDSAMKAIKLGAYDYISKPFQIDEIKITARNAIETMRLTRQNEMLLSRLTSTQRHVEELRTERIRLMRQLERLDRQIESSSQDLMDGVVSLKAIPKNVLLQEYARINQNDSVVEKIAEIVSLKENGLLSEEEFIELKRKLFAKL